MHCIQALLDAGCLGLDQPRGRLTQQALAAMGLEGILPEGRGDGHTLLAAAAGNGQVASIKVRAMGGQEGEPAAGRQAGRGAGNVWRLRHIAAALLLALRGALASVDCMHYPPTQPRSGTPVPKPWVHRQPSFTAVLTGGPCWRGWLAGLAGWLGCLGCRRFWISAAMSMRPARHCRSGLCTLQRSAARQKQCYCWLSEGQTSA